SDCDESTDGAVPRGRDHSGCIRTLVLQCVRTDATSGLVWGLDVRNNAPSSRPRAAVSPRASRDPRAPLVSRARAASQLVVALAFGGLASLAWGDASPVYRFYNTAKGTHFY